MPSTIFFILLVMLGLPYVLYRLGKSDEASFHRRNQIDSPQGITFVFNRRGIFSTLVVFGAIIIPLPFMIYAMLQRAIQENLWLLMFALVFIATGLLTIPMVIQLVGQVTKYPAVVLTPNSITYEKLEFNWNEIASISLAHTKVPTVVFKLNSRRITKLGIFHTDTFYILLDTIKDSDGLLGHAKYFFEKATLRKADIALG
ncbi:hypothetical protein [Glaciimonas soli]|uniref:Uncharacterized protein n=1 Tax=Glaciimonas soli TaxID=2590999 RepID=A0A843YTJ2_9BURK|nr:hypothetical protein [Glaciimonas soli]MQR00818.1 hypothetical protein [Glaciimonas soli]